MRTVNENTTLVVTATFKDEDDVAVVLTAITVRIDDVASGAVVRTEAAASVAASIDITVTQAENVILDDDLVLERKRITVEFTYESGAKGGTVEFDYQVKNLRFVT